jgi:cutinase
MSALVRPKTRAVLGAGVAALACAAGGVATVAPAATAATTSCSAVNVVFARGTGEAAGLGSVGGPFVSDVTSDLPGTSVSSYAVNYSASASQSTAGQGATDMSNHISSVAASCPSTSFIIGGYSQGATVVDIAIGIRTATGGTGTPIPASLASRVKAVVVFGNPLGLQRETIAGESPTYGPKADEFCNTGDPVCGNGFNIAAHLEYVSNGSAAKGATFAAGKIG